MTAQVTDAPSRCLSGPEPELVSTDTLSRFEFFEATEPEAIFEGRVLLQSHKKWRDAYAVVTKSCVRCYQLGAGGGAGPPIRLVELAEDADALEAQLELLPDYARRSRHIELYSFCVKTAAAVAEPEPEHGPGDGCLLMAVRSASAMWEWALKIRWRDELPVPSPAPRLQCYLATHYDDHFSVPSVLQNRLLHVMTYKRIGIHNVRIEAQATALATHEDDMIQMSARLERLRTRTAKLEVGLGIAPVSLPPAAPDPGRSPGPPPLMAVGGVPLVPLVEEPGTARLNTTRDDWRSNRIGDFAMTCLIGTCIHAAERNFELMMSTGLVDLAKTGRDFNSPLSMTAEGNWSPGRGAIVRSLVKDGSPVGRGWRSASRQFVHMLCKPQRIGGVSSVCGVKVHDDDKRLTKFFIAMGDGVEYNEACAVRLAVASVMSATGLNDPTWIRQVLDDVCLDPGGSDSNSEPTSAGMTTEMPSGRSDASVEGKGRTPLRDAVPGPERALHGDDMSKAAADHTETSIEAFMFDDLPLIDGEPFGADAAASANPASAWAIAAAIRRINTDPEVNAIYEERIANMHGAGAQDGVAMAWSAGSDLVRKSEYGDNSDSDESPSDNDGSGGHHSGTQLSDFTYNVGRDTGMTVFPETEALGPLVNTFITSVLTQLDLHDNSLTTLPDSFYNMVQLERLNLSNNLLWSLSPAIARMTKLVELDVRHNLLESLPDELEQMITLQKLSCSTNPITYPPQSVVRQGLAAIRQFFADGRRHGTRANTDLKVLVLGLSEAGKTSLINGILDGSSRLMRTGDRTVGIEQRVWSYTRPDPTRTTADSIFGETYAPADPEARSFILDVKSEKKITLDLPAPTWATQYFQTFQRMLRPKYEKTIVRHLRKETWFWGVVDIAAADALLKGKADGTFLVHQLTENAGRLSLSVMQASAVKHIAIVNKEDGFAFGRDRASHPTITDLITNGTAPGGLGSSCVLKEALVATLHRTDAEGEDEHEDEDEDEDHDDKFDLVPIECIVPREIPKSRELTNIVWDKAQRRLTGDVLWTPFKMRMAWGQPHEKWSIDLVFSANFNAVEQGSIRFFREAYDDQPNREDSWGPNHMAFTRDVPNLPEVNLLLFDFAGQQEYYIMHHIFLTERALYVLAFDLSKYSKATFDRQIMFWMNAIQDRCPGARLVVVGTHADLLDEDRPGESERRCQHALTTLQNKRRRVEAYLKQSSIVASARLKELDTLKYVAAATAMPRLHPNGPAEAELLRVVALMFPSKADASDSREHYALSDKDQAIADQLSKFIEACGEPREGEPRFFLDPAQRAEASTASARVAEWGRQRRQLMPLPERIFPVSSAAGLMGMDDLLAHIKQTVENPECFPQLSEQIPTSYFQVRASIRAKRTDKDCEFMRTDNYLDMLHRELKSPADGSALSVAEIERATSFMHDLGEVLYYKKDVPEVVFLKVSWLVDAMKFIIRHDHEEATVYQPLEGSPIADEATFDIAKAAFLERGELSVAMLEHLWAAPAPEGLGLTRIDDYERFWAVVALLERFEVAAVTERDADGVPRMLIVPEFEAPRLKMHRWQQACPEGKIDVQRWFRFYEPPPRGVMQRWQVKLSPQATRFDFAKEGAIIEIPGAMVFCRIGQGLNPALPKTAWGLQLIVRGERAGNGAHTRTWEAFDAVLKVTERLLSQWPGLRLDRYAVHQGATAPLFLPLYELEALRRIKNTDVDGIPIDWLLGPIDGADGKRAAMPEEVGAAVGAAVTTGAAAADPDAAESPQAVDERVDVEYFQHVVSTYRASMQPWVMLSFDPESQPLAMDVFAALTEVGIPAWIQGMAGVFGTSFDELNDGHANAAVFVPILSQAYEQNAELKQQLLRAVNDRLPIVPVTVSKQYAPCGWVAMSLADSDAPAPLPLGALTVGTIDAVVAAVSGPGLVTPLPSPVKRSRGRRERRLSFGRRNRGDDAGTVVLPMAALLSQVLGFSATAAEACLTSLATLGDVTDDADDLLLLDEADLAQAGVRDAQLRALMAWIGGRKQEFESQA